MTTEAKPRIQRVYLKDVSFEAPSLLETMSEEWKPEVKLDMNNKVNRIDEKAYEVILIATATVNSNGKLAYLCEVQQAGIFTIEGIEEQALPKALGSDCPQDLFPFAREAISNLVTAGGYPPLLLAPVDFSSLYETAKAQQEAQNAEQH